MKLKLLVYLSCLLIILNFLLPVGIILAEEATPSAEISVIPTSEPTVTPTPEATSSATPTVIPTSTPAPIASDWKDNGNGSFQTINDVVLDKEYTAVQNDKVKIKFNKLSNPSGKIAVKEIKLSAEQLKQTKALSDTAYDISSTMENNTFEYTLTLPALRTENVEVKASEDGNNFVTLGGVTAQTDTLTITGLNHFTIFVIAGTISEPIPNTFTGEPFDEADSSVVINEFVYNPSSGSEWVELFNKTGSDIDLSTFTIEDRAGHIKTLSGTIPGRGIFVYDNAGADFLNNTTINGNGDIIYLKDGAVIVDEITYQKEANGTVINNTSSVVNISSGQSLYRTTDGGSVWAVASSPSKGWFNNAGTEGQAPLLSTIDTNLHDAGMESNIGELANPSSTPATEGAGGLYFEKIGQGKIVFEKALNLSDQATVAVLQGLGSAMEMSATHIKFDSDIAEAMKATGAKIYMYGLNTLGYLSTPDIIIKDDDNNVLGRNDPTAVESINYDSDAGTLSFSAKHFTQFDLQDQDIALVASDKEALTNDFIKGGNANLSNVTTTLTNPLPSLGSNGSTITWVSNNTSVISNNGQIVVRPVFGSGNTTVTLTATITKGAVSDTKTFTLIVLELPNPAKVITAFSFSSGIGVINETNHIINVNVPYTADVTALVATFAFTGSGVTVGGVSQVSATTANNFTTSKTYRVTALDGTTQDYTVAVTILASTQTAPNGSGNANLITTTPQVVISDPTQAVVVTVPSNITNPTINYGTFISGGTGVIPQTTIDSDKADIVIPASTTVTSTDATWDGIMSVPTVTIVTLPETSGQTKTLSSAIEVGFSSAKLSFDKGVRILMPNQAGKRVGYTRPGTDFTEITSNCAADNQATGDALATDSECKIDMGLDLVIWTKHFTKFATYTQTTNSSSSGGGSSNSGSDGGDGLGCAVHDCSVHPVVAWQTQTSNPVTNSATGFKNNVLGALIDNTSLSFEPSDSSDSASITPSSTAGEVKGIASTTSDNWWLLFFGVGGLALLYWFAKHKQSY